MLHGRGSGAFFCFFCKMTDFRGGGESERASLPLKLLFKLGCS